MRYRPDDPAAARALNLASEHFDEIQARPPSPEDTETCRLAALAAAQLHDWEGLATWRTRWLARAAAIGWTESIGFFLVGLALSRFAADTSDAESFDLMVASPTSEAIVGEIAVLEAVGPSGITLAGRSPSWTSMVRQLREKQGVFRLAAGDWAGARASFEAALAVDANSARTRVKVGLSLASTLYLSGAEPEEAIAQTKALGRESQELGYRDLAERASANVQVMELGSKAIRPYEVL
jgi:hypothetical protein